MKVLGKLFFVLCFLALGASATAQLSIGPRAGINLAKWNGDEEFESDFEDIQNRLSLLFGAVAEIRMNDNFAIQPELNFIQKGFKVEDSFEEQGELVTEELSVIMNYLEIPVMLKGGVSFGAGRFDVLAGPSLGYALNGKLKYKYTFAGETETESEDIDFDEDEISRIDFGLQFGGAFSFKLGETATLFADARYLLGLSNLNDSADDSITANNRGIAISVGALFPL